MGNWPVRQVLKLARPGVTHLRPTRGILVDLAAVTFLDCTGMTALLTGCRSAATRDVTFQAVNAGGIALRALQTLDLDIVLSAREPH